MHASGLVGCRPALAGGWLSTAQAALGQPSLSELELEELPEPAQAW